eukprot:Rmarinus@m.10512
MTWPGMPQPPWGSSTRKWTTSLRGRVYVASSRAQCRVARRPRLTRPWLSPPKSSQATPRAQSTRNVLPIGISRRRTWPTRGGEILRQVDEVEGGEVAAAVVVVVAAEVVVVV